MNSSLLLPAMMLVPLLGAVFIAFTHATAAQTRRVALVASLLALLAAAAAAIQFDWSNAGGFQLRSFWPWVPGFGLNFSFGIDAISLWLVLLTALLMPVTILGAFSAIKERTQEFYFWLLLLETAMLGTFIATDLIFFYICFEFTLVPLYFLIGVFGSTERLRAARVFFLYTFTGSMLTFAGVLYVAWFNYAHLDAHQWTFDIQTLYAAGQAMSPTEQAWVLLALLAGFAVKVPIFPFHTWLPLAHTEAPTAGSVILAGVLLKLGTYGLLRFAIPMTPHAAVLYAPYIAIFAIIGILYTALICWVQKDIKKLIAYSSVSHLGFCVLGMFALNTIGMGGSIMYMINHGLSTGALFLCVGMIYERFHTREMARMGGLAKVMPIWASFLVFFTLASVGLPGLNGFVGEFLTLLGAFTSAHVLGPAYGAVAASGMILAAIYLLYMLGRVVWGPLKVPVVEGAHGDAQGASTDDHQAHAAPGHQVDDLNWREIGLLAPLAVACLVLGLYPTPMLHSFEAPIANLTAPAYAAMKENADMGRAADARDAAQLREAAPVSRVGLPRAPVANATPAISISAQPARNFEVVSSSGLRAGQAHAANTSDNEPGLTAILGERTP